MKARVSRSKRSKELSDKPPKPLQGGVECEVLNWGNSVWIGFVSAVNC
jgi:hypothetical protein